MKTKLKVKSQKATATAYLLAFNPIGLIDSSQIKHLNAVKVVLRLCP
jgi:hypothetical protein